MSEHSEPSLSDQPNLIWIFGDQHRAQALSCHGDPNVHTPNIDRLAHEGIDFANAVSGTPLCTPFRGSLLTGQYPHKATPGHEIPLPSDVPTIAEPFKAAGYRTSYFGKWHLDGHKERNGRGAFHEIPPERRGGFDDWVGYENNNSPWDSWVHGTGIDGFEHLDGFESDVLTDRFIEYLKDRGREKKENKGKPFFASLSVQPPHDPYVAPAEWMGRHNPAQLQLRRNVPPIPSVEDKARCDLAGYYGAIENLDWNLGRIRQCLSEQDLDRETVIIFFSDHGDMHGSHGLFKKTNPMEESMRIPFIIGGEVPYYGRKGRSISSVPHLINHVDIAPTSLGLCGITPPSEMMGTDYSSCFNPNRPAPAEGFPDSAFAQLVVPTCHGESPDRSWRCIVTTDGWKYAVTENGPWLLYDLKEDPNELRNLAFASNWRKNRSDLHERLANWIKKTDDPFNMPAEA
tara:strand:- start:15340 stop:16713 length:1374 start_codon:yes stop_codon:yes gene_type:complete